jgi:hypothetical protein
MTRPAAPEPGSPAELHYYRDLHAVKLATAPFGYTRKLGGSITAAVSPQGDVTLSNGLSSVTIFAEHINTLAGLFTGVAMAEQPDADWTGHTETLLRLTRDHHRRGTR